MDQITQIINDPDSMKQVMQIAQSLGKTNSQDQDQDQDQSISLLPAELTKMLHHAREREEKHQALVSALLPYLRPGHQKRLQRAIEIARLSQLAGAAFKTGNMASTTETEASYDV